MFNHSMTVSVKIMCECLVSQMWLASMSWVAPK